MNTRISALIRMITSLVKTVAMLIASLLVLISLPYSICPVYDFPEATPFQGSVLYNPYEQLADSGNFSRNQWLKANFHAHSQAWAQLTHGNSTLQEVSATYKRLQYDLACVSNYHRIDTLPDFAARFVSSYEHGYNVRKNHQICVAAEHPEWLDFPFVQGLSHKQFMLQRLKKTTPVLIIAHPSWQGAYPAENMRSLTDYDALEPFNHFRESVPQWDSALSAGRAVWGVGADDSHDARGTGENGVCWTMIAAKSVERSAVVAALQRGACYAVKLNSVLHDRWRTLSAAWLTPDAECVNALNDAYLHSLHLTGDSLTVQMDTAVKLIRFVGQSGIVRKTLEHTAVAGYTLLPEDTYIRTEILTQNTTILLNPVFRYSGTHLPRPQATINIGKTILSVTAWFLLYALLIVGWLNLRRRRTQSPLRS
jgi:hypothetical protein